MSSRLLCIFSALLLLGFTVPRSTPSLQEAQTENVDIILVVDLSKTMRGYGDAGDIFSRVQTTMKDLVRELDEEDTVTIIPFGDAARALPTITIYGDTERRRLFERIDDLSADQSWTYTAEALRLSLQEASRLEETFPNHRQVAFILTDGRNNPPPGAPDGYNLDIQNLAESPPTQPWYVYQVQYGDQIDQALDSLITDSDILKGGTIQDENAQGGIDSLRSTVNRARSFTWSASSSSISLTLESSNDTASASVQFNLPDDIGAGSINVELDRSEIPKGIVIDHDIVSRPENRAKLTFTTRATRSFANAEHSGSVRISPPNIEEASKVSSLEIPLKIQTSMVTPAWLRWLWRFGGGLLAIVLAWLGYREWNKRQLFGELAYWPTGDMEERQEKDLGQFGMSATIGSDLRLRGTEGTLAQLSVEKEDGQHLVVVRPEEGNDLVHGETTDQRLPLYDRDQFEIGDYTFEYDAKGAVSRRPRRRSRRR